MYIYAHLCIDVFVYLYVSFLDIRRWMTGLRHIVNSFFPVDPHVLQVESTMIFYPAILPVPAPDLSKFPKVRIASSEIA